MRPSRFSRLLWVASGALVALVAGCDLIDSAMDLGGSERGTVVAYLESTLGTVQLERGGKKDPAVLGYLYVKDAIETSEESTAKVGFTGGRVLEIGPDARVVINQTKSGLVLEVARGLVLTRVTGGEGSGEGDGQGPLVALSIETPFGTTRMGTELAEVSIEVGETDAKVNVLVGSVELLSRNGQSSRMNAGDHVSLTAGEAEILDRKKDAEATLELAPIEVTVAAANGRVELKRKDAKKWQPVGKAKQPLAEGDGVRAGRDGRSIIEIGSGELSLERDSELVFQKSGRAGDVSDTEADFKKGSVSLRLAVNQKHRVKLAGLSLQSDLGGQFGVLKTKDGFEVTALAGDVLVSKDGGPAQLVTAGQIARIGAQSKVLTPDRADLALPSRPGMKVYHQGLSQAALTWAGGKADYLVEVALDASFSEKIVSGQVHDDWVNVAIPRKGNLYWRVFKADGTTKVDQGSAYFAPEPPLKDLARLRNDVPEGSETTTIFYQDKPPAVTFTYRPEQNAVQYKVVVFRADNLEKPVVERSVPDQKLPLEAGVLTEGNYVWSVTPLSEAGEELRGGRMNKLEMVYDNSVPTLAVLAPRNGEGVAGGQVQARGVAPVGAKLFVNGKPVELDEKNRFDSSVSIGSGRAPLAVFRVSKAGEPDAFTVRVLRRSR